MPDEDATTIAGLVIHEARSIPEARQTFVFHGFRFEGKRYDCGDKIGFLEANIAFALQRPDMAPKLRAALKDLLAE